MVLKQGIKTFVWFHIKMIKNQHLYGFEKLKFQKTVGKIILHKNYY